MDQGASHFHEGTLRDAGKNGTADTKERKESGEVIGGIIIGERLQRLAGGLPMAALIPNDAAVFIAQRRYLRHEHGAIQQNPVRENNCRAGSACVLIVKPLTVDIGKRHPVLPIKQYVSERECDAGMTKQFQSAGIILQPQQRA